MAKYIPIHPGDGTFVGLMRKAVKGLREGEGSKLLEEAKKEFAEADISLFYNKESNTIRVLKKDSPPIDFPVSQFEEKAEK